MTTAESSGARQALLAAAIGAAVAAQFAIHADYHDVWSWVLLAAAALVAAAVAARRMPVAPPPAVAPLAAVARSQRLILGVASLACTAAVTAVAAIDR